MLGYPSAVIDRLPTTTVASFAGTGNPFLFGDLNAGEQVVDVGGNSRLIHVFTLEEPWSQGQ
jgi:hypothetical protein